jgi:hypothetical protein
VGMKPYWLFRNVWPLLRPYLNEVERVAKFAGNGFY